MFSLIWQLLVGLVIGVIARLLIPGKEEIAGGMLGWLITALVGMGGSFIGTMVGRAIWKKENYAAGWIMSILGAVGLLLLLRFLFYVLETRSVKRTVGKARTVCSLFADLSFDAAVGYEPDRRNEHV